MTADYGRGVSGATAGVNSLVWYSCSICGACVVEYDRSDIARKRHDLWHDTLPPNDGSGATP